MGIVSFCPQGHRIKVKDRLAGKTGVCPTCGARFRIPLASVEPPASGGGANPLPEAKIMSLDATIAARLPRVLLLSREPEPARPVAIGSVNDAPGKPAEEDVDLVVEEVRRHPLIAERPDLAWCLAVPGGTASEPMQADAMQAWLDSGRATGDELVWRADWSDWRPIAGVFPESLRR
ncbi:MAG: DUF4339 domain-containing protein [Planctomycetaceae bacterium]|jgi:hypothetical protein|nr:DUF4339 domain-containing protein [Planctomycetaceae bacterium]